MSLGQFLILFLPYALGKGFQSVLWTKGEDQVNVRFYHIQEVISSLEIHNTLFLYAL